MIISVIPIMAQPTPPAIWIEPATNSFNTASHNIGDQFTVVVWVETTADSYTWQVTVTFDPSHLNVVDGGVDYTGTGKSLFFTPKGTIPVVPIINNATGIVQHGESLVGADFRVAGRDSLFYITFVIMAAPPIGGSISSLISAGPSADTFVLDPNLDEITGFNFGDSTFEFIWSAPPAPYLAVDPPLRVYDQYSIWNGTTFDEEIYVMGISGGWFLDNVTLQLTYNSALLQVNGIVVDPFWTGPNNVGIVPGDITIEVDNPTSTPSGDVLIATVTFEIIYQGTAPPDPAGFHTDSPLDLNNYFLGSSAGIEISTSAEVDGLVQVYSYQALEPPHLEVSSVTMGPGPSRGREFNVTVSMVNLDWHWNLVGIQFRLGYNATLIEPVAAYEGPFMPYWASMAPGSLGTFWTAYFEPDGTYGPHVLVGNMVLPNGTGMWNLPLPDGSGVIAIITFKVLYQSFGEPDIVSDLLIVEQLAVGLDNLDDQNVIEIALNPPVNGTYTITTDLPGRMIDLYGGAVNMGYGSLPFPEPYGGQGPNMPMDLVLPQSWVQLCVNVTYNYWPVQHKLVGFEVQNSTADCDDPDPEFTTFVKLFAFTDENGVACVGFRMPWPCDDPEGQLFGLWRVTATVSVGDVVMTDVMDFKYDYLIHITKVTTDLFEYDHGWPVEICIEYKTWAMQDYPVVFTIVIKDELGVPIGMAIIEGTVGGAVWCQYKYYRDCVVIYIPKWAYAGIATIHVNAFDKEPIDGGVPVTPEYTPAPTIAIQPY
jgi:hypothetical protein